MKPVIGCLTTFANFDNSYSLCSVVESQLIALVKYGYKTILFTHDNFEDDAKVPKGVEIRKTIPRFLLEDYTAHQSVKKDFETQVDTAYKAFKETLKDIDIVIEHDLILQGWFLPYCVAIHKLAEESKIKWFHWVHSVPNPMPAGLKYPHTLRYHLPKNSKLVYLNNTNIMRASEAYNSWPKDVRIVYNPVDPRLFWNLHPLVKEMIDKYPILEADFLQVYPISTPRMGQGGKQINVVIDVMAHLKELGNKVCLIACNAHANADKEKGAIEDMLQYAVNKGLTRNEVLFTSLQGYEHGVPKEVVSQFFKLSNLFIFPTCSENCPLILLEAMLSGCMLILNNSLPQLREFGKENALYFDFGSLDQKVNYDNKDNYMKDVARVIISEYSTNKALKASALIKQKYNYDDVFKKQIEPLFTENG